MRTIFYKADTRGKANHGWLSSKHTFSFANYYNPNRMQFGVLRVLNDDTVIGGYGFDTHSHRDMEIITIPLEGALEHKDSMGNINIIKQGDVQVMSAGTGIQHSEYNHDKNKLVKFLQIWIHPNQKNVVPRYDQITFDITQRINRLQQLLSPNKNDESLWVHQNTWINITSLEQEKELNYEMNDSVNNGLYAFLLSGEVEINGLKMSSRDGLGLWEISIAHIKAFTLSEILLIEIPMLNN